MCSCTLKEVFIDVHNGDSICIQCGTCTNDIFLDNNGNQPPETRLTVTNYDVALKTNFQILTSLLKKLLHKYNVNDAFHEHGYAIISHMEKESIELRGNKHRDVCMAIIYSIYSHFNIFWDLESVCKSIGVKQAKIKKLAGIIVASSGEKNTVSAFHKHIIHIAQKLDITVDLKSNYIDIIQNMSKSTRMKTAIFLFTQDNSKIQVIINELSVQKNQLLSSYSELKSLAKNSP